MQIYHLATLHEGWSCMNRATRLGEFLSRNLEKQNYPSSGHPAHEFQMFDEND
jgi:hypothetical protein